VLNSWWGMPLRAAAATSALMIGVTATGGAIIYYGRGDLQPLLAAPAVLGVQVGSGGCGVWPEHELGDFCHRAGDDHRWLPACGCAAAARGRARPSSCDACGESRC